MVTVFTPNGTEATISTIVFTGRPVAPSAGVTVTVVDAPESVRSSAVIWPAVTATVAEAWYVVWGMNPVTATPPPTAVVNV